MPDCAGNTVRRVQRVYQNDSERFVPQPLVAQRHDPKASLQQYFVLYRARLAALKPAVEQQARLQFPGCALAIFHILHYLHKF